MTELNTNFVGYFKDKRETALETLVRITFGTFIGGLRSVKPGRATGAFILKTEVATRS